MKVLNLLLISFLITTAGFAANMDKSFLGSWSLNVAKSDFGPGAKPKMGVVNWTEHGWSFAMLLANDLLIIDAVITDHGCSLIGDPADYACEFTVVTPRHVTFRMKQGNTTRVVSDFELIDNNTTKVTHRRTPQQGQPVTEQAVWERAQ